MSYISNVQFVYSLINLRIFLTYDVAITCLLNSIAQHKLLSTRYRLNFNVSNCQLSSNKTDERTTYDNLELRTPTDCKDAK